MNRDENNCFRDHSHHEETATCPHGFRGGQERRERELCCEESQDGALVTNLPPSSKHIFLFFLPQYHCDNEHNVKYVQYV